MSRFLFIVAIDWVMVRTVEDVSRGINLTRLTQLEDLDNTDDMHMMTLLSYAERHIHNRTNRLWTWSCSQQIGLSKKEDKAYDSECKLKVLSRVTCSIIITFCFLCS